jgi:hypothetical protein
MLRNAAALVASGTGLTRLTPMHPYSYYLGRHLRDPAGRLPHPVLLWQAAPSEKAPPTWQTRPTGTPRPAVGEPVVFEIRSQGRSPSSRAPGITLGRSDLNDIAVEDLSVSLVHAYFQATPSAGDELEWRVIDAGSRNGSTVNGAPLAGQVLRDADCLRVGDVDLHFYSAEGFRRLLVEATRADPP